jgi:hypothetical protein
LEYSTEQQQRLGVDAQGKKVAPAAASPAKASAASPAKTGAVGVIGPSWTRGEIEAPAGVKDMGGWQASVYTPEQQARLKVDAQGNKVANPAAAATKAPASPLPDKWESRCSAFSAQKYWFNGGKNSVSLRDPSKMVGGQLAHAAAAAAAASAAPSPLPVASKSSPSPQTKVASDVKASVVSKPAVEAKAVEAKAVVDPGDSSKPDPASIAGGGASDASGAKKKKKKSGKK